MFCWQSGLATPSDQSNPQASIKVTPKQIMSAHTDTLRDLMLALYTRHANQLAKSTQVGPREMTEWVFEGKANWKFDALRQRQGEQALVLLQDEAYTGDAILPMVVGLESMLFHAYGAENEYAIPQSVEESTMQSLVCRLHDWQSALQSSLALKEVMMDKESALLISQTFESLIQQLLQLPNIRKTCT